MERFLGGLARAACLVVFAMIFAACGGGGSNVPPAPILPAFGMKAAGLYVFNTGPGVSSPEIQVFVTNSKTGATHQAGSAATGSGLGEIHFTMNGAFAYGLDGQGNVWGYRVDRNSGMLTKIGIVASGLPATSRLFKVYGNKMVWVAGVTGEPGTETTTIYQYPIIAGGKLGAATDTTLAGDNPDAFIPPGSAIPNYVPTAVWTYQFTDFFHQLATLNVYPVNSDGAISGTSEQNVNGVPELTLAEAPATFAYAISQGAPAQSLITFTVAASGILTAASDVPLPGGSHFWAIGDNQTVPNVGGTIDLVDPFSTPGQAQVLVYPVSSTGTVGAIIQNVSLLCGSAANRCYGTQFASNQTINAESGPVPPIAVPAPSLWLFSNNVIDEYSMASNGAINPTATSLAGGQEMLVLFPGQPLFSYGSGFSSGTIFAYGVSSAGALNSLGSFAGPPIPANSAEILNPFPANEFKRAPVALYVDAEPSILPPIAGGSILPPAPGGSIPPPTPGGSVTVLPIGANGLPSSTTPLATINVPHGLPEPYVILNNGFVASGTF
ncbi:MAG: hypothetical protein ACREP6_01250 [Candidatus Binataceae bacterium]